MRRFALCSLLFAVCAVGATAAPRDVNAPGRTGSAAPRATTTASARTAAAPREVSIRGAANTRTTSARAAAVTTPGRSATAKTLPVVARTGAAATPPQRGIARAAIDETAASVSETRTGAAYEQCKDAYFTCMDQFCKLKNDDYRRCSCSDRVYDLGDTKSVLTEANTKLTAFTESLDSVGMTAAQATAMKTSSEGENALMNDSSSSKALLQAIMNSIKGEDTNVGGKFSSLNSINLSFDTANAFGMADTGQVIAAYNGKNLYTAVYPQCRNAVRADCTDAALQRAVTAYLMAVEQDCNTVQSAITDTQKKMTAAVREGSAMLDLARVENRQNHNSDDMTACLGNVEQAILSEEVCGAGYHKCLDNGEFIDVSTGAPIAGVVKFYELEHLLTFNETLGVGDQKLAKISNNRMFVTNFEKRVKKFAEPALDKCAEKADDVWGDYLDKAMLDIYYAQKAKVLEIKQGCFDFVSSCYVNGDNALTAAMTELMGDSAILVQPGRITLNGAVCSEYVASCSNMFDGDIVKQYVAEREQTDTLAACRAVAKQCFDKFGGSGYENFYYPYSGLFKSGQAPGWFALYKNGSKDWSSAVPTRDDYQSECAKQLFDVAACSDKDMMEKVFGGLDVCPGTNVSGDITNDGYGTCNSDGTLNNNRQLKSVGVATEVYYQIIDTLNTQCNNLQGRFMEVQFTNIKIKNKITYNTDNTCLIEVDSSGSEDFDNFQTLYGIANKEDMCPKGYGLTVDVKSWGACNCWENGARRSRGGNSVKCMAEVPTMATLAGGKQYDGAVCPTGNNPDVMRNQGYNLSLGWCQNTFISATNQVCPFAGGRPTTSGICNDAGYVNIVDKIPEGHW